MGNGNCAETRVLRRRRKRVSECSMVCLMQVLQLDGVESVWFIHLYTSSMIQVDISALYP
jgi:hypothetical protein